MDKFFEELEKSKGGVALGISSQVEFDETAEILEKGRKAAIGEIRDWKGTKMQKTAQGWVPVKKQPDAEPKKELDIDKIVSKVKTGNGFTYKKDGDRLLITTIDINGDDETSSFDLTGKTEEEIVSGLKRHIDTMYANTSLGDDPKFLVLKSKENQLLGILGQVGFDETADILEKGRRAQMGEMRIWNGIKYQKTPNGWIPVKEETKAEIKLPEEGKLIYEPKNADTHNKLEVEKVGDKFRVREVGNNGKRRFVKETDAAGVQEMLKEYTLDMDKNTAPKEKKYRKEESDYKDPQSVVDFFEDEGILIEDVFPGRDRQLPKLFRIGDKHSGVSLQFPPKERTSHPRGELIPSSQFDKEVFIKVLDSFKDNSKLKKLFDELTEAGFDEATKGKNSQWGTWKFAIRNGNDLENFAKIYKRIFKK